MRYRKLCKTVLVLAIIFFNILFSYASYTYNQEYRDNLLYEAKVIDSLTYLDEPVKRSEFAKIIVSASPMKDTSDDYTKVATENKYMIRNVYGDFREEDLTSYNDLIRGCLALLGYEDKDFTGNKVNARAVKFIELELNKNIDKDSTMMITKHDVINAIYNTLKEKTKTNGKKLYTSVFSDMTESEDGELNLSSIKETKIDGPHYIERNDDINGAFDNDNLAYYINGRKLSYEELLSDIENYGYAVCYYDYDNNTVYAYTERTDISLTVACMKGYVDSINYKSSDMTTPYTVDIGLNRYKLASDEMTFAFSFVGHIRKDDKVVIVYNKINDIVRIPDELETGREEGRIINGSIITAFKVD